MQSILESYQASRHHDVIQSYISSDLRPQSDPYTCKYVAASYFQLGSYKQALELQEEIFTSFDGDPLFLSMYGATLRHLGRFDEAHSAFTQALEIDADNPTLKNNFANLLIDLKEYSKAHEILSSLIESDPQYSDARTNLMRVEQYLQNSSNPVSNSSVASGSDEKHVKDSDFYDPLFYAFSEDEVKRTAPFRPSTDKSPKSKSLDNLKQNLIPADNSRIALDQLKLAEKAVAEGNPKFALELCSKISQLLPAHAEVFSCVGDAYISLKRFKDAESSFLHALNIGGDSFKLYFNLATISIMKKQSGLAAFYLRKASSIDASHPQLVAMKDSISQLANTSSVKDTFSFLVENPYPSL